MSLILAMTFAWGLSAEPVCAKRATTLRKAPNGAVSWKVGRYMPFVRVDTKNGWAKLTDLDGEVHFARANEVTHTMRCVVVKAQVANLHREPSGSAPAADLKTVDRFTPFQRVNDQGDWIQVKDEAGRTAWISSSQVWKPVTVTAITF